MFMSLIKTKPKCRNCARDTKYAITCSIVSRSQVLLIKCTLSSSIKTEVLAVCESQIFKCVNNGKEEGHQQWSSRTNCCCALISDGPDSRFQTSPSFEG